MTQLRDTLLSDDPKLAAAYEKNRAKREMALLIRSLRKKAGLTQVQVAARSGMSQSHISKMESASGGLPEIESYSRYFDACGVDLCIAPLERDPVAEMIPVEQCAVI